MLLLTVAVLFLSTVAWIGLAGDFPLNDDWSYAIAVRRLVATGAWQPLGFTAMPLITNALWATPVCAATACGFDNLRLATLLASLLLFCATFLLVRQRVAEGPLPLLAAWLLAFNPVAYALSFTFMTDILFAALVTVSAALFTLSLERDAARLAALGTLVATAATLSRQLGLCVPLAYLIVRLLQTGGWRRKTVLALAPLLFSTGALMLFHGWLQASGRLPILHDLKSEQIAAILASPTRMVLQVSLNLAKMLLYLGLFSLPMLLLTRQPALVTRAHPALHRLPFLTGFAMALLAVGGLAAQHQLMPLDGNILVPQGIGPLLLHDVQILGLPNVPHLPLTFWGTVTLLSLWGAFELTCRVVTYMVNTACTRWHGRFVPGEAGALFALIAMLVYAAPLLLLSDLFERYFVPMLPLLLFFLAGTTATAPVERFRAGAGAAICLVGAAYAVLGTHDYMAWNRARWAAVGALQAAGIAGPATLDGGFEYNGFFAYDPAYQRGPERSWWWVDRDDYMIAFGPIEGMRVVSVHPYATLLPPAARQLLVLARPEAAGR